MAEEILASVQVRRDSKANWEAANPVLLDGEAAYEKDTDMFKIGDGVNNYKNLPYHNTGASGVTKETDPTVPDWAKQPSKPTYTASEVGADAAGTAAGAVAAHNVSGAAHEDLRALIGGLTSRLNALADSDDTTLDQLSEIVAYIKSNKALIDAVTMGKVSTSDIVDNLTTNSSGKVLSAAQGVALKAMIDGIVIPTALPNPQPITINGQRYDGSESVTVTVSSEGGGTPVEIDDTLTQSGQAADAKAVGDQLSALNEANATQDERLTKLEQTAPSGTSGLTVAQVNALDGMFKIAAYTEDASSAYAAFKSAFGLAESIPATGITLSESEISFADSNPITLTATVAPSNSTDAVVWQSDNTGVATVNGGVVTPVADGNCTITATAGAFSASCAVTVDLPDAVVYTITNNLTGYTTDNDAASVAENGSYSAALTVMEGYTSQSVTITMGGVDITETAWQDGMVVINGVTGDIVITAIASALTVLDIDDTRKVGTSLIFYSGTDDSAQLKSMLYVPYALTKFPANTDTQLTVVIKNNTESDVSVGEIYAGMVKRSATADISRIKAYNSMFVRKVDYALTPGNSVEFTVDLYAGYHLILNRVENLTYTIAGDLGEAPVLETYEVAYKKHGGSTNWYSSEDETTKLGVRHYPGIWYTTEIFVEDTDVLVTVYSETGGNAEGYAGISTSDPNATLPNVFFNAVDMWNGDNNQTILAGIPVTGTYTVKAGNYLFVIANDNVSVTVEKAVN